MKTFHLIILACCVLIITAGFVLDADRAGIYLFGWKWPIHCVLYKVFGVKCALCGMSRSFVSMANGDLAEAFGYHYLGPIVFLFIAMQIPYRIWAIVKFPKKAPIVTKIMTTTAILLLAAIFFNWFCYLAERFLWTH